MRDRLYFNNVSYFEDILLLKWQYSLCFTFRVCVTSVFANRTYPDLHLFRNYPSPHAIAAIKGFKHPDGLEYVDIDTDQTDASCWDDITGSEFDEVITTNQLFDQIKVKEVTNKTLHRSQMIFWN